jgi:iron complex outermembrane receptor protein
VQAETYWEPAWGGRVVQRLAALARVHHRSSRFADPAGLIVIPSQTSTDFELRAELWEHHLSWRLALQNAFDVQSFDTVGLPLPGRSLYSSLELSFGRNP